MKSRRNTTSKSVNELRQRLRACVTQADQEQIIKKLVADSLSRTFRIRHEARTLLLAYLYGEPSQRQHHVGLVVGK